MLNIFSKPVGTLYRSSTDAQKLKNYNIAAVEEKSLLSYVKIVSAALICSVYTDIMSCGAGALNHSIPSPEIHCINLFSYFRLLHCADLL